MTSARNIMIQGTMSNAGKSLLCTALCRIFRQDGWRVAPFKSQNMALNSYITRDGLEMGRAQVAQAEAAGIEPDVRMNPILLKPSSDTGSQIIVQGRVRGQMQAMEYYEKKQLLVPAVQKAYDSLAAENDILVLEGAGSPAEINLREHDLVNMGMAEMVNAPVLLAGDIDRGGVFAQLYGTCALLTAEERARIEGLIINKFRGDAAILAPGIRMLEERTEIPVLGVVPYTEAEIDEEDSLAACLDAGETVKPIDIAVIRLPRLSNFTDFAPLQTHAALGVRYVDRATALKTPDLIILPGTKSTMDDLLWLRESGLEAAILKRRERGIPVMGICGGYQMLGERLQDPELIEGTRTQLRGMGLLPTRTVFSAQKVRTRVQGTVQADVLAGARVDAYEIHMGKTIVEGKPFCRLDGGRVDGCTVSGVMGTYLHGLFDTGEVTDRLAAWLGERKGLTMDGAGFRAEAYSEYKERQYDLLAAQVREALDIPKIYEIMDRYAAEREKSRK